jgi:uncharacterized protein (DUF983 family)
MRWVYAVLADTRASRNAAVATPHFEPWVLVGTERGMFVVRDPVMSSLRAGLACRCPRCGQGAVFAGALTLDVRERCDRCGLSFKFVDTGDGPAVFAIMLLGFLMMGLALVVEFKLGPPLWVHVLLWAPITLLFAFGLLRPMKSTLIALQFKHKAEEARLAKD